MTLTLTQPESIYERVLRLAEARLQSWRPDYQWRRWQFDAPHTGKSPVEVGALLQMNTGMDIDEISSENNDNRFDRDKCNEVRAYARKTRRNPAYNYFNAMIEDGVDIYKKRCYRCNQQYPATQSYFYPDKTKVSSLNTDGLMSRCKWCHNLLSVSRRE